MSVALPCVTRIEIAPCPMDICKSSLQAAATQLGAIPDIVYVHPYDRNLAVHHVYEMGWRHVRVDVNHTFKEDEWSLYDSRNLKEIHSEGA